MCKVLIINPSAIRNPQSEIALLNHSPIKCGLKKEKVIVPQNDDLFGSE
jgi:hypothetical protein